ncbi:hypothetical protein [Thermodesulfatator atlanticus]
MKRKRNKKSRYDEFYEEIKYFLEIGLTKRSAWKIINSRLADFERLSYPTFLHFLKTKGLQ